MIDQAQNQTTLVPGDDTPVIVETSSRSNIADQLTYFKDYLTEFPNRIPTKGIKNFALLGIMVFGSIAGVVLLKQNLDVRKQASEGNSFLAVCADKEMTKLASTKLENSTGCLLNGKTYYACNDGYTMQSDQKFCMPPIPTKSR